MRSTIPENLRRPNQRRNLAVKTLIMPNVTTVLIPEAWHNGARLRSSVRLDCKADRMLIYDLERTFVIEIPSVLHNAFSSLPRVGSGCDELHSWFLKTDLLTSAAPPQWPGEDDSLLPTLTDVSIDLSGNCNMGCTYCFERSLLSRMGRMDNATLAKTLDFVFQKATDTDSLSLHFGSGEPLIEFGLLRKLVTSATKRAERLGIRIEFELTTNATLVDKKIVDFLAAHPFNVRVSCDGPAPIHNLFRPLAGGRASYDSVISGLDALLAVMPERVTVNSVICSGTRLITIWNWAKSLGLRHLHVIKVGSDPSNPAGMELDELAEYEADLEIICGEMFNELARNQRPIDFQPISKVVRRLMLPAPINRYCGVAGSYLGVATDGAVYPCFRHLGVNEYRFGDVRDGVDDAARIKYRKHEAATVDNRLLCRTCWVRYMCGGGCYADSVVYGPDPLAPQTAHCPFWRAEIDYGIRFFDRLRNTDPSYCLLMFGDNSEDLLKGLDMGTLEFAKQHKTF